MIRTPEPAEAAALLDALTSWYDHNGRDVPMRADGVTPWGTLVFEVMSQQTPLVRVAPVWLRWMRLWPAPADLADAPTADVLVEWSTLGYPSRALRLQQCATRIRDAHGGAVPTDHAQLLDLPGVGGYTAAALASFQFHQRIAVLDVNIRRVASRLFDGIELPASSAPTKAERERAEAVLPEDGHECAAWNLALMEFGALVCTQRSPDCPACPIRERCRWAGRGYPRAAKRPRTQQWRGTDRQARGRVLAALRAAHSTAPRGRAGISRAEALRAATLPGAEGGQAQRALASLIADRLVAYDEASSRITLP